MHKKESYKYLEYMELLTLCKEFWQGKEHDSVRYLASLNGMKEDIEKNKNLKNDEKAKLLSRINQDTSKAKNGIKEYIDSIYKGNKEDRAIKLGYITKKISNCGEISGEQKLDIMRYIQNSLINMATPKNEFDEIIERPQNRFSGMY